MRDYWDNSEPAPAGPSRGVPRKAEVRLTQEDADRVEFVRMFMLMRFDAAATSQDVMRYALALAVQMIYNGYGPDLKGGQ